MTEDKATSSSAASLGNARRGTIGHKTTFGQQHLGKLEQLGELVYKSNTKDQADMYLRTTEAIADYVGVEYGRDMRMLVKNGTVRTFTEPKPPEKSEQTDGLLQKYKTELTIFHRDKKEYEDHKSKVFVMILGQCTQTVKSKLESDSGFAALEKTDDVVGLLKKLKEFAFMTGKVQDKFWTLQEVLRRLTQMNQGPTEATDNYARRYMATVDVLEAQWGQFCPIGLADSTSKENKKKARDKILASIFLAGADKKRYGTLIENLNNTFLAGNDQYPVSIDDTLTLLSHYQDHRSGGRQNSGNEGGKTETSFAQASKQLGRIRCFLCNEFGHVKKDCPRLNKKKVMQQVEETSGDDGTSTGLSWSG